VRSLTFLYHELRQEKSDYSYALEAGAFEQHVALFGQLRREIRPGGVWPEVSFDDGHISNHELAAPALEGSGIVARFFITAGWTGQRAGYMGWRELRELQAAGHQIGAHGWTHTLLTHCSEKRLKEELARPRRELEDGLGVAVTSLSLPGGRGNRRVLAACRAAGYTQVFSSFPRAETIPAGWVMGRLNVRGDAGVPWLRKVLAEDGRALGRLAWQHRMKAAAKAVLGDRLYGRVWAAANRLEEPGEPAS
jgi:peptidoglycan/xylan/chitin deacetylase (PgdA/CDA1 family)